MDETPGGGDLNLRRRRRPPRRRAARFLAAVLATAVMVSGLPFAPTPVPQALASSFCELPGPDAGGYVCDSTPYSWADTTGGIPVLLSDDSVSAPIPLPFPFTWYGQIKGIVYIGSNGLLCFDPTDCTSYIPSSPPNSNTPNDLLACFWEDLNPANGGTITFKTVGSSPNSMFVVEFNGVPHYFPTTQLNTFQFQLAESGEARCMLQGVTDDGDGSATAVGIEDSTGSIGLRYKYASFGATNTGVRFTPSTKSGLTPVALWKFDEGSGTTATDSSGNGNHGSLLNGPSWMGADSCKSPGCLGLDGVDDYVSAPHSASLSLLRFSVSVWVYPQTTKADWQPLVTKEASTGGSRNYGLFIIPNTTRLHYSFLADDCSTTWRSYDSAGSMTLNDWNHLAMTYDGSSFRFYLNGALDSSQSVSSQPCRNSDPVKIGRELSNYTAFQGRIDEVAVFDRGLSATEVEALYATSALGSPGPAAESPGPAAYWKLDEETGTTAHDFSGHGRNGTLQNGPTWKPATSCKSPGCLGLDGVDDYVSAGPLGDSVFQSGFTVEAWVKFSAVNRGEDNAILGHGTAANGKGLHLGERAGKAYFGFYFDDVAGSTTLAPNTWYHIAFVYDGGKKIYVNGAVDASGTSGAYTGTGSNAEIARYPWATNNNFYGSIDEVTVWPSALSADAVLARYLAASPDPPPNDPPGAPALVSPAAGVTFRANDLQSFAINATDPDGDPYKGTVTITNVSTGASLWVGTSAAASGDDSTGAPAPPLAPGSYTWSAKATDAKGSESLSSATRSFTVSANGAPGVPTLIDPPDGKVFVPAEAQIFTIRATDPDGDGYTGKVTIRNPLDGIVKVFSTVLATSGSDSTGSPLPPLPPGSYTWSARATDAKGSAGPESVQRPFAVSSPGPGLPTEGAGSVLGSIYYSWPGISYGNPVPSSWSGSLSLDGSLVVGGESAAGGFNVYMDGGSSAENNLGGFGTLSFYLGGGDLSGASISVWGIGTYRRIGSAMRFSLVGEGTLCNPECTAGPVSLSITTDLTDFGVFSGCLWGCSLHGGYINSAFNQPPSVPSLVAPSAGEILGPNETQIFTARAADPNLDAYTTVVTVRDADGTVAASLETVLAPSESGSTGFPSSPLRPGTYTWKAHAVDVWGAVGAESQEATFRISPPHPGSTTRVSVSSAGREGNERSWDHSVSADGRYVAFSSNATNLVSGDTNNTEDVFVRDRATETTTRVSLSSSGTQGNGWSRAPSISADGRYLAFHTSSLNTTLVPGDTNSAGDVFVRDRATGATTRVSVSSSGEQGNNGSFSAAISADGRYVAFVSDASNLVSGDTNGARDVFVRDLVAGTTIRASVSSSGAEGNDNWAWGTPAISADGRYVAFVSDGSNLVSGDTNGARDVFVRDLVAGTTIRASVSSSGAEGNGGSDHPSISADGRYLVFASAATNLVSGDTNGAEDIFVRDLVAGTTIRVSLSSGGAQANAWSRVPTVSSDGAYVSFWSAATNLVSGDTNGREDVFLHDRAAATTTRVSVSSSGEQANSGGDYWSGGPSLSANGQYVVFRSYATNLVPEDTNSTQDVFVYDRAALPPGCDAGSVSTPAGCLPGAGARSDGVGLESFYPYRSFNLGVGAAHANLANGNLAAQFSDLEVPGQGLNLRLTRTYNSQRDGDEGPLGMGWTLGVADGDDLLEGLLSPLVSAVSSGDALALTSYEIGRAAEVLGAEDTFDFYDADGTRHHFTKGGLAGPGWHSPPGVNLTLSDSLNSERQRVFTLTRPDGVVYRFEPVWLGYRLTTISDRKGNALTFSYLSEGKLWKITDTLGRYLEFFWSGDYLTKVRFTSGANWVETTYNVDSFTKRLTSVTEAAASSHGSGSSRTTSYTYSSSGLSSVTDPRGSSTGFTYSAGKITQIADRAGKAWTLNYGDTSCISPVGGAATCLTDPEGAITIFSTSPEGNLIHQRDAGDEAEGGASRRNDRSYVWEKNRLTKQVNEAAHVTEYDYNPLGQITEVRRSGGGDPSVTTKIRYQEASPGVADMVEVHSAFSTPEGRVWAFENNPDGTLNKVTDPLGGQTNFAYYVRGLLKSVTDPRGSTVTYGDTTASDGGYHPSGQPPKVTDPTGAFATFSYDFLGRMTSKVDRAGKTWSHEYDLRGNQTKQIDPLGNDTWFCYDANDNQTLVVLPKQGSPSCPLTEQDAHVTKRTYDQRDLLSSTLTKSDTQLRKTVYSYYDDGELKEINEPRSFDSSGGELATVQKVTYLRYPNNRVKAFVDEEGGQTDIVYTPEGLPRIVTDPPNSSSATRHTAAYTYNWRGQVKTALVSGHSAPTTHTYNLHGERISSKTPKGNTTVFEHDKGGRLTKVTDANGRQTTRAYDASGNLVSLTQPKDLGGQATTSYIYTARGEIATESDPADTSHTVDYFYDLEGRQRFRHDKYNGTIERTVEQTYDDAGRLTQKNSTGTGLSSHRTTFSYDQNGNTTAIDTYKDGSLTVNLSAISIGYTTADEVSSWNETIHSPSGGSVTKSTSFAYERDGLLTSRITEGQTTTYEHLRNGREKKTTPFGGTSFFSAEHFGNGALKKITLPNGTTLDQGYDLADRMISRVVKKSGGQVLSAWEAIAYDEEDNRISEVVSQLQTDGSIKQGTGNYSYDKLSRLTSAKHPFDPSSKAYAMDDAGNIVSDGDFTYSYSSNRLTSRVGGKKVQEIDGWAYTTQESFAYEHDRFGNVKKETRTFTVSDALSSESSTSETTTSYNAASHTKRVASQDGSYVDYFYDGLDRLVARLEHPVSGADVITLFFHDQMSQEIALETDGAGTAKTRYILDSTGDPLGKEEYGNSTGRSYFVEDPRGNVTQLIDSSEAVKATFAYDPFGKEKPEHTSKVGSWDSRLRFQKSPQDPKTGAYTLGPRLYDPQINRFVGADFYVAAAANLELQIDPLTGNRYLYAGANPNSMIDDGHAPKKAKCGPKCRAKRLWKKNLDCPYLGRGIPGWCEEFRRMPPEAQGAIAATLTAAPVGVAIGGGYLVAGAPSAFSFSVGTVRVFASRTAIGLQTLAGGVTRKYMLHLEESGLHAQYEIWWKRVAVYTFRYGWHNGWKWGE